jgi:hypothetical protein
VNYVATDGLCLLGHRADLKEKAPDNTLLGSVMIPKKVCSNRKAWLEKIGSMEEKYSGEGIPLTLTHEGANLFQLNDRVLSTPIAFAPMKPFKWSSLIPGVVCTKTAAHFQLSDVEMLTIAARNAVGAYEDPHIEHNANFAAVVTWEKHPQTFGLLTPCEDIAKLPLTGWAWKAQLPTLAN